MQFDHKTYARILDNLHDGLYFVDTNRRITYWNNGAERITGFLAAEVVGRSCADNILTHVDGEGNSLCFGCCPLAASITDGRMREAEVYLHHKDGHRVPVFVRVSALCDSGGKVLGGLELFTDMSAILVHSARVQELEKLAMLDTLTRLANRNYLEREFRARFEKLKRYQESSAYFLSTLIISKRSMMSTAMMSATRYCSLSPPPSQRIHALLISTVAGAGKNLSALSAIPAGRISLCLATGCGC